MARRRKGKSDRRTHPDARNDAGTELPLDTPPDVVERPAAQAEDAASPDLTTTGNAVPAGTDEVVLAQATDMLDEEEAQQQTDAPLDLEHMEREIRARLKQLMDSARKAQESTKQILARAEPFAQVRQQLRVLLHDNADMRELEQTARQTSIDHAQQIQLLNTDLRREVALHSEMFTALSNVHRRRAALTNATLLAWFQQVQHQRGTASATHQQLVNDIADKEDRWLEDPT